MGEQKTNSGQFSSDRQPKNRRGRGKSKRNQLLQAMAKQNTTEVEFWEDVLKLAQNGEMSAVALIANRLLPALKPATEKLATGLVPDKWLELSRASKMNYLAMLVLSGRVSVDVCVSLCKMLESAAIAETTDQLDLLLDGQVVLGDGDKKSIDKLKFAQDLSDRVSSTVQADIQRLRDILTDEKMGDTDIEPDTDNDTEITTGETVDE